MTRKVFRQSETDKGIPNNEDASESSSTAHVFRSNAATTAMKSWTHCVYKSFSGCFGRVMSMQTVKLLLVIVMIAMPILLSPIIQYALYRYSDLNKHTFSMLEAIVEQKMASHNFVSVMADRSDDAAAKCATSSESMSELQQMKSIVDESVHQNLQTEMNAVKEWMSNAQHTMDKLSQYEIDVNAMNSSIALLNEQLQRQHDHQMRTQQSQMDAVLQRVSVLEHKINVEFENDQKQTFSLLLSLEKDMHSSQQQQQQVDSETISSLVVEIARMQSVVNDTLNRQRQWNASLTSMQEQVNASRSKCECNSTDLQPQSSMSEEDIADKILPTLLQSIIETEHIRFLSYIDQRNTELSNKVQTGHDEVQLQLQAYDASLSLTDRKLESVQRELMTLTEFMNNQSMLQSTSLLQQSSALNETDFTVAVVFHSPLMTSSKLHAIESSIFYFFTRKYDQNSIRPIHRGGDCTPLKQNGANQTYIIFELRQPLHVNGISYEHISPSLINDDITSAPKTMSLEFSNDGFRFFNCSQCDILTFNASQSQYKMSQSFHFNATAGTYKYVKLNVLHNYGADWTCVYRVMVHGIL